MIHIFQNALLFLAKVLDNAIGTSKTIMIQRSRWLLAGLTAFMSDFIYFWITKKVVSADTLSTMLIVAVAGGVGCSAACFFNERMSKDRTYVNVIMSDNMNAMKDLSGYVCTFYRYAKRIYNIGILRTRRNTDAGYS